MINTDRLVVSIAGLVHHSAYFGKGSHFSVKSAVSVNTCKSWQVFL